MPILHHGLAWVAKKSHRKCARKIFPLGKRATKTPRRPANSTGKWRRPNKGGALAPAFMAELGLLFDQKSVIAVTMPIVTAFKFCIGHRKNGLLNR
jgi:hypothetical protein